MYKCSRIQTMTSVLPFRINIKHGYSIIGTFSLLHGLIQNYMFINFEENILPSWLFGPTHGIYSMDKCNALQQARPGFCTRRIGQTWFLNSGIQPFFHAHKQTEVTWAWAYYTGCFNSYWQTLKTLEAN